MLDRSTTEEVTIQFSVTCNYHFYVAYVAGSRELPARLIDSRETKQMQGRHDRGKRNGTRKRERKETVHSCVVAPYCVSFPFAACGPAILLEDLPLSESSRELRIGPAAPGFCPSDYKLHGTQCSFHVN